MLTDFGLMKDIRSTTQITQAGTLIGTFDYAAPEQLQRGRDRRPLRRLRARRRALPGAHRQGPVPARDGRGDDARAPGLAAAVGAVGPPRRVRAPRRDRPARDGEGAGRALPVGRGPRPRRARRRQRPPRPASRSAASPPAPPPPARSPPSRPSRCRPRSSVETGHGEFVGRTDPLARLEARYAAAEAGQRQFVLLAGEPGIGKTRLATELARRAHAEGATVLYGRSDAESLIPYQPFITALDHFVAHREQLELPPGLELELGGGPVRPRAAPARGRQLTETLAEDADDAPLPAVRGRRAAARASPPASARSSCSSTTCTGPTPRRRCCSATCSRTSRRCGCWCSAPPRRRALRSNELGELISRMRRQPAFERIELDGLTPRRRERWSARGRELAVRAPAGRGDRGQPVLHRGDAAEPAGARGAGAEPDRGARGRQGDDLAPPRGSSRETANQRAQRGAVVGRQFDLQLLEELVDEPPTPDRGARGGGRGRARARGRRGRPLHLRPRPRTRDALRGPEHKPPRAAAPAHRRGAGADRGREPRRARLPLLRGPGAERPSTTRSSPAEQAAEAFAYDEAAEHYRRASDDVATLLELGAAELRAGDPAARGPFARRRPARTPRTARHWPRPRSGSRAATPRRA